MMQVAERLVEILEENGITHIFGIPGEQIMPMYRALSKSDIRHVLTRHEQAAAHAADAFTRTSDNIGVCMATAGPGALNAFLGACITLPISLLLCAVIEKYVPQLLGQFPIYQEYYTEPMVDTNMMLLSSLTSVGEQVRAQRTLEQEYLSNMNMHHHPQKYV